MREFSRAEKNWKRGRESELGLKEERQKAEERDARRKERRIRIARGALVGKSEGIASRVLDRLSSLDDETIMSEIAPEIRSHPDRYSGIEAYERVRLMATALANMYEAEDRPDPEDLLDRAHLFVFEDDAWWGALGCADDLQHLPFEVCLVEDVLLWETSAVIRKMAVTEGADEGEARRLMAYVTNRCSAIKDDERVTYVSKALPALGGSIDAPSSTIAGDRSGGGRIGPSRAGRSPRSHRRRGHWRNQAYGPGMRLHRRIWISETLVTPNGGKRKFTDHRRVHVVRLFGDGELAR